MSDSVQLPALGAASDGSRWDGLTYQWRLFVGLIFVSTLVPYVVMPLSVIYGGRATEFLFASTLLNFLGGHAHISATAFFYSDPEMRKHFWTNKIRYLYMPLALILGVGVAYSALPVPLGRDLLLFHFMWQTYHYQRQNYGVLSFFCTATDRVRVSKFEKLALQCAAVAGMLALIKLYALSPQTILQGYADLIFRAASFIYMAVPVLVVAALVFEPRIRRNPLRLCALALFSAFYLPSFIFSDPGAATLGYALGHGLQYLVFMYFVGASRPHPFAALVRLLTLGIGGGFLLTYMTKVGGFSGVGYRLIFGMAVGTVMSHFVIDAGVWKLRDPFQRRYVQHAMPFIFHRAKQHIA